MNGVYIASTSLVWLVGKPSPVGIIIRFVGSKHQQNIDVVFFLCFNHKGLSKNDGKGHQKNWMEHIIDIRHLKNWMEHYKHGIKSAKSHRTWYQVRKNPREALHHHSAPESRPPAPRYRSHPRRSNFGSQVLGAPGFWPFWPGGSQPGAELMID